jgi:hypothetical protein
MVEMPYLLRRRETGSTRNLPENVDKQAEKHRREVDTKGMVAN